MKDWLINFTACLACTAFLLIYLEYRIKSLIQELSDLSKSKPDDNPGTKTAVKPVETVEPSEKVELVKPVEPVETVKPVEPVETVKPVEPVETVKPVEPVETVEPVEKVETVKPGEKVETVKPVEPVETVEPGEKVETVKPVEKVETVKPGEKVETVKPVEPVETGETGETGDNGGDKNPDGKDELGKDDGLLNNKQWVKLMKNIFEVQENVNEYISQEDLSEQSKDILGCLNDKLEELYRDNSLTPIQDETTFDWERHKPAGSQSPQTGDKIECTVTPGWRYNDRIFKVATVSTSSQNNEENNGRND